MKGKNIKRISRKRTQLDVKTWYENKKLHYFFATQQNARQKPRKRNIRKWGIIDFKGQIETKYNRISILVL